MTDRARKTLDVRDLLDEVNRRNRNSTCDADQRKGWNSLLEAMLFRTGNYAGFRYLSDVEVPTGEAPGIRCKPDSDGGLNDREFPDETRISYYVSGVLLRKGE